MLDFSEVTRSALGRKGIAIIALPLAFSVIFVIGLRYLLQEAQAAADKEARSKEIIYKANNFGSEMVQIGAAYYMTRIGGSKENFINKVDKIRKDFAELEALVPPDSTRGKLLAKTRINLEKLYEVLTTRWEKKFRNAELFDANDAKGVRSQLQDLLSTTIKDMDTVVLEERLERKRHPMTSDKYRSWIDTFLLTGLATNFAVAIALAGFFSNGITRRVLVMADNSTRLAEGQALHPPVSGDDEIAGLDKVFHEMADKLSEARQKEQSFVESLKLSEARLRSMIDTIPLGLLVVDSSNSIRVLSPSAEKLFGYSGNTACGRNISTLFSGELAAILDSDSARETRGITESGEQFPAEIRSTQYNTADMDGRLLIVTDITQRYEVDRLKQSFVSMVSHELRSPLLSIQMCMSMMLEGLFGTVNEDGEKAIGMAAKSVVRLIGLVNEILDVERLESGSIAINPRAVSVLQLFELAVGSIKALAEAKNISLEIESTQTSIWADEDRIVQVIVNLLANAVKFSPENSKVIIGFEALELGSKIFVQDYGRGIPQDQLALVFDRFYQVNTPDGTAAKTGSGLGLAICKAIVEAHHGTIEVESTVGVGSLFSFTLPAEPDDFDDC